MLPVDVEGADYKVLLTKAGEIDGNTYVDPRGEQVMTVDHMATSCTAVRAMDAGEKAKYAGAQAIRSAVDSAMSAYLKEHYSTGTASVFTTTEGSQTTLTVCIGATKTSPRNFWSGRWRSTWTCVMTGGSSAELSGKIQLQSHYYESGNVQMHSNHDVASTIEIGADDQATAVNISAAIAVAESTYQQSIDDAFITMSDTALKQLRRKMMVSVTKFNFSQYRSVATELKK